MYDCIVVGAGPIGNFTAGTLAENGLKVLILEEHENIGIPVHCTGIVSSKVVKEFDVPSECIRKRIKSVKVHFPSGEVIDLPTPIQPYVLDRVCFDQLLAKRALQAGAELLCKSHVNRVETFSDHVRVSFTNRKKDEQETAKICVIASGSLSRLPAEHGLTSPDGAYWTAQVDARIAKLGGVELFLGSKIAPGSFGYAVNINGESSKVGLITRVDIKAYFDRLLSEKALQDRILDIESNPRYRVMPFGIPENTVKGRIATVGDAARQIKTTTGGGIYYGLKCADILSRTILESHSFSDFNPIVLKQYDSLWKRSFKTELKTGLILRKLLENIDDAWWNDMASALQQPDIRNIIERYRDFDKHRGFITEFFRFPQLRSFLFRLIGNNITNNGINKVFLNIVKTAKN